MRLEMFGQVYRVTRGGSQFDARFAGRSTANDETALDLPAAARRTTKRLSICQPQHGGRRIGSRFASRSTAAGDLRAKMCAAATEVAILGIKNVAAHRETVILRWISPRPVMGTGNAAKIYRT